MKPKFHHICCLGCLLLLGACSADDEPVPENDANGKITFSAQVPNSSRAASTTTATIKEFVVYAFTEGATLMDGVTVTRNCGQWTYSPEAYWPVQPVSFYAFSPDITESPNITGTEGGNIPGYVNDGQVDLLYSVKRNVSQQAAPVNLNFRHAMAKASVLLSSTNNRIKVKVSHILFSNLYIEGTFDFPTASTEAASPDVTGRWSILKDRGSMMTFYAISTEDQAELTPVATDYTENNLDCAFAIPQPLAEVDLSAGSYSGNYIGVDCEIFDSATGAKLWPNSKTPQYMLVPQTDCGRIVYPMTSGTVKAWEAGHHYVYNIQINNPTVLDKIEFDVTVDDFIIAEM